MHLIGALSLAALTPLTMTFGLLGLLFSLLLIFSPATFRRADRLLSRPIDVDGPIQLLDRPIASEPVFYARNRWSGAFFVLGALFILSFSMGETEARHLAQALFAPQQRLLRLIAARFCAILLRLAACMGLVIGLLLLFAPSRLRRFEARLNSWVSTRRTSERLNRFNPRFDALILRHPLLFGLIGAAGSLLLIVLSAINRMAP